MEVQYLCKDLKLTIQKEPMPLEPNQEQIRAMLIDELTLEEVFVCYPINTSTLESRKYHVWEAVILSVRRILGDALANGMIKVTLRKSSSSPGVSIPLNIPLDADESSTTSTTA